MDSDPIEELGLFSNPPRTSLPALVPKFLPGNAREELHVFVV